MTDRLEIRKPVRINLGSLVLLCDRSDVLFFRSCRFGERWSRTYTIGGHPAASPERRAVYDIPPPYGTSLSHQKVSFLSLYRNLSHPEQKGYCHLPRCFEWLPLTRESSNFLVRIDQCYGFARWLHKYMTSKSTT